MSAELVRVPVSGAAADLMAVESNDVRWAALKPMCDSLGIDTWTQQRKLNGKSWATTSVMTVVAADGRSAIRSMRRNLILPLSLRRGPQAILRERRQGDQTGCVRTARVRSICTPTNRSGRAIRRVRAVITAA